MSTSSTINIPPQFDIVDQPLDTQMTISMGPQHPSTHGVLRLELVLDGEMVVKATPDIGYLHTGMEKLFEYKKYQQGIVITDRMDYLNPLGNNLAYVMAVEKLLQTRNSGTRADDSRADLRTAANRFASGLARHACARYRRDDGLLLLLPRTRKDSEPDRGCFGRTTDAVLFPHRRFDDGYAAGFERRVQQFLDGFLKSVDEFHTLLTGNRIFQKRTQGVGVISAEDAIDWGLSGPCLARQRRRRSTSVAQIRTRVTKTTILKYRLRPDGDVWARYMVRMREMKESHKIVAQALGRLKPGPVKADAPKVVLPDREAMKTHMDALIHHFLIVAEGFDVPAGEVYFPIEASKGELGVYVKSNGGAKTGACSFPRPQLCESFGAAADV